MKLRKPSRLISCAVLAALLALSSDAQQSATDVKVRDEATLSVLNSPLPLYLPRGVECPDAHLRSAEIGGSEISAALVKDHKSIVGARAELFSGQKPVWAGATNQDGMFRIRNLAPGLYKLRVEFWGTTTVRLNPKLSYLGAQTKNYHLLLTGDGCVGAGFSTN